MRYNFLKCKRQFLYFEKKKKSLKFVPNGANWQHIGNGLGIGLAPIRQQAIT